MARPTLKLRLDAVGKGSVELDGHDISNTVAGVHFTANVGDPTTATLTLIGVELDVDASIEELLAGEQPRDVTSMADESRVYELPGSGSAKAR